MYSHYSYLLESYVSEYNSYFKKVMPGICSDTSFRHTLGYKDYASNIFDVSFFPFSQRKKSTRPSSEINTESYFSSYKSLDYSVKKQVFLVIPSFFNSADILNFNSQNSFIRILQEYGDVFLINWLETNNSYRISDVVSALKQYVINNFSNEKISLNIVGHCIGGIIGACLTDELVNKENKIINNNYTNLTLNSLSFLTCSWRFDHFKLPLDTIEYFKLDSSIRSLEFVPKTFIQIMFFMLYPNQFIDKINKYFLGDQDYKEYLFEIENWLQSGINLPSSLYFDIIDNILRKNFSTEFTEDDYSRSNDVDSADNYDCSIDKDLEYSDSSSIRIGDRSIDLGRFDLPIFICYAKDDKIVPQESTIPLIRAAKKATVLELPGGHISYLVNNIKALEYPYKNWLSSIIGSSAKILL